MKFSNTNRFKCLLAMACILHIGFVIAQETNTSVYALIKSSKNEILAGASVIIVHVPTGNRYTAISRANGVIYIPNLKPGGPYSLTISHVGFEAYKEENLMLNIGKTDLDEYILTSQSQQLKELIFKGNISGGRKNGFETQVSSQQLNSMPGISRNFQDYIRLVPQSAVTGDGVMSLAGQNNKYNAFFIDGANNNDILGVAQSGTNTGLTGTPPISIDAVEQINVMLSPYDVQYSNFLGGSINAITKSGTNTVKSASWYLFRNEQLAGKTPMSESRTRLQDFFNQTFGVSVSGPLVKNKLFYFVLAEKQMETSPQPFNVTDYSGTATAQQLDEISELLKKQYGYDPGSYKETKEEINAVRTVIKMDWNPGTKNKLTLIYRNNFAEKQAPQTINSNTIIRFSNNGYTLPAKTKTATLEWKSFFSKDRSNRFMVSLTRQLHDRNWLSAPFPAVSITDGRGRIFFGSQPIAQLNHFKATDLTIFNAFRFIIGQNKISLGVDINHKKIADQIVSDYFGNYQYRSVEEFLSGQSPFRFQRNFPIPDIPKQAILSAGSFYNTTRAGFFINDELTPNKNLTINLGLRLDGDAVQTPLKPDQFFNDTAFSIISSYYNLDGAKSGLPIKMKWQLSPRLGITYRLPKHSLTFRAGTGIFKGDILNVWLSSAFAQSNGNLLINPQFYGLTFNPDPYNQPNYQTTGISAELSKGSLSVITNGFKYPAVLKSTFSVEKVMANQWVFEIAAMYTKNIHETKYTNVNIIPPVMRSALPDSRNVYSLNPAPERIPLRPDGSNPYSNIILQGNNDGRKGYSYNLSAIINKTYKDQLSINAGYNFGYSVAMFEPTGNSASVGGQWANYETVDGKNYATRSRSDFDYGHRLFLNLSRRFNYARNRSATVLSLFYNGQSGAHYSYVYSGSMINDNTNRESYDLVYVPTHAELDKMVFVPVSVNGVLFSAEEQKVSFNDFLEHDPYLHKNRGQFSKRNGARLPATHIIDIRIQQEFSIKMKKDVMRVSLTFDVFNFTNMLNKNWGRMYFQSFDNFQLLRFAGFADPSRLVPQYQYTPVNGDPYSIQTSTAPGNSARWIGQLGFRVYFN